MNFPFNFIIIPGVIIATAVIGAKFANRGRSDSPSWYRGLKKPSWTPSGAIISEIWTFLYVITGLAILWYWNVPAPSWFRYGTAVILLANAYLNATWNRTFFIEHDLHKSYKQMQLLNGTTILATIVMFIFSPISSFLMLPYIIWVSIATNLTKKIISLNSHGHHGAHHSENHHSKDHQNHHHKKD